MRYTFGSSNTAAERLYKISEYFNPRASEFIKEYCKTEYNTGLDIGCGPGFTTHMLASTTGCKNIYGLDISDNFLKLAKEYHPEYNFIKHDITEFPFPVKAEIAYTRFELSHLNEPVKLINKWASELTDGGMLFIDEVEKVETGTEVFRNYLDMNEAMIANQGACLFVGNIIGAGKYDYKVLCNKCVKMPVPEWQAASWFYPNTVTAWKEDEYVKSKITDEEREAVSREILEIQDSKQDNGNTFWFMRRLVINVS